MLCFHVAIPVQSWLTCGAPGMIRLFPPILVGRANFLLDDFVVFVRKLLERIKATSFVDDPFRYLSFVLLLYV